MVDGLETPPIVLIVDDEAGLVELFASFLEPFTKPRTATTGTEAMKLVDSSIDAAIIDRRMPGKSGDEVLDEIRAAGYRFPVAMVTAVQADVDIIEMPLDVYVTKPVSRDELHDVVEVLVRHQGADERRREFFRLAAKKRALEANPSVDTGSGSEFNRLVDRLETLQQELDGPVDEFTEDRLATILPVN